MGKLTDKEIQAAKAATWFGANGWGPTLDNL